MASTIALTQDSGGKKNITSNRNKKGNDNALDDTDSEKEDEDVDKTGNDNMKKRPKRKSKREKGARKKRG